MIHAETTPSAKRILVAEDVEVSRYLAKIVLESGGHEADVVANGAEAVDALKARDYDLVLMDLDMPILDGYAASAAIRRLPADCAHVPIVALTGSRDASAPDRCRSVGMDACLKKPFQPDALLREIALWTGLGSKRADAAKGPFWDRSVFGELASRIGAAHARDALDALSKRLGASAQLLRDPRLDREAAKREAHNVVSLAGMFGFLELSEASRALMCCDDAADFTDLSRAVLTAVDDVTLFLAEGDKAG